MASVEWQLRRYLGELQGVYTQQNAEIAHMKHIINQMPGGVFWKNLEGVYEGFNHRCIKLCYPNGPIQYNEDGLPDVYGMHTEEMFMKKTGNYISYTEGKTLAIDKPTITTCRISLANNSVCSFVTVRQAIKDAAAAGKTLEDCKDYLRT